MLPLSPVRAQDSLRSNRVRSEGAKCLCPRCRLPCAAALQAGMRQQRRKRRECRQVFRGVSLARHAPRRQQARYSMPKAPSKTAVGRCRERRSARLLPVVAAFSVYCCRQRRRYRRRRQRDGRQRHSGPEQRPGNGCRRTGSSPAQAEIYRRHAARRRGTHSGVHML